MEFDKKIHLLVVLILVVGAIFYIESLKSKPIPGTSNNLNGLADTKNSSAFPNSVKAGGFNAPELAGIKGYINTREGFRLSDLKGKVIIVDFWTYSCINCLRTLPYLNAWYEKYHDKGLEIVGVHTPEFDFEKEYGNVNSAVSKYEVKYPVVLDNDYATWQAYKNRYWPHEYIIDASGNIRHDHIGEGGYEETEQVIQQLLQERNQKIQMGELVSKNINSNVDFNKIYSPEIYLGYKYTRNSIGNIEGSQPDKIVTYNEDTNEKMENVVYLQGSWMNNLDNVQLSSSSGSITLRYNAKSVNIVAGGNTSLKIYLDGTEVSAQDQGTDAQNQIIIISGQRLYNIISTKDYGAHTVKIETTGKEFELYTFTFG